MKMTTDRLVDLPVSSDRNGMGSPTDSKHGSAQG